MLALLVIGLIASIVSGPFQIAGQFLPLLVPADDVGLVVLSSLLPLAVGQLLASTVTYPLTAAVTSLQYVDQRMRLEGLDVELARAPAPAGDPAGPPAPVPAPAPPARWG